MGEETTWFDLLPGVRNLELFAKHYLARDTMGIRDVPVGVLDHARPRACCCVLLFMRHRRVRLQRRDVRKGGRDAIVPPSKLTLRNLFEMFTDAVCRPGRRASWARRTRAASCRSSARSPSSSSSRTCLALIPGFAPPTATLKTNVGAGADRVRHDPRLRRQGQRPRLLQAVPRPRADLPGAADDARSRSSATSRGRCRCRCVSSATWPPTTRSSRAFFVLVPLLVPVPFLILGVLVVIIQTMVFCLLTMVYIQGAVEPEHGDDHGDGHHAHEAHH